DQDGGHSPGQVAQRRPRFPAPAQGRFSRRRENLTKRGSRAPRNVCVPLLPLCSGCLGALGDVGTCLGRGESELAPCRSTTPCSLQSPARQGGGPPSPESVPPAPHREHAMHQL